MSKYTVYPNDFLAKISKKFVDVFGAEVIRYGTGYGRDCRFYRIQTSDVSMRFDINIATKNRPELIFTSLYGLKSIRKKSYYIFSEEKENDQIEYFVNRIVEEVSFRKKKKFEQQKRAKMGELSNIQLKGMLRSKGIVKDPKNITMSKRGMSIKLSGLDYFEISQGFNAQRINLVKRLDSKQMKMFLEFMERIMKHEQEKENKNSGAVTKTNGKEISGQDKVHPKEKAQGIGR